MESLSGPHSCSAVAHALESIDGFKREGGDEEAIASCQVELDQAVTFLMSKMILAGSFARLFRPSGELYLSVDATA